LRISEARQPAKGRSIDAGLPRVAALHFGRYWPICMDRPRVASRK
jgi:hypothetical protein